jgi:hypothetical protein
MTVTATAPATSVFLLPTPTDGLVIGAQPTSGASRLRAGMVDGVSLTEANTTTTSTTNRVIQILCGIGLVVAAGRGL